VVWTSGRGDHRSQVGTRGDFYTSDNKLKLFREDSRRDGRGPNTERKVGRGKKETGGKGEKSGIEREDEG
jgi:hypothetical protein